MHEAAASQRHLATIQIDLDGDVLVLSALSGQQDHASALLQSGDRLESRVF
jgi:hypothetical protein